jgi:hypothetical protein
VSGHEFDAIGEEMEKREHQHFGEDGFEKAVAQVAELERKVGLYDLTQLTPSRLSPCWMAGAFWLVAQFF